MLNSLAILKCMKAILSNELAAVPGAVPFAERAKGMKMALRSMMDALLLHFGVFEEGLGPGEGVAILLWDYLVR